jgi:hypothetical protein
MRRYRDPIKLRSVVSCINGTLALQAGAHRLQLPMYIQQGTLDKTCKCVHRIICIHMYGLSLVWRTSSRGRWTILAMSAAGMRVYARVSHVRCRVQGVP